MNILQKIDYLVKANIFVLSFSLAKILLGSMAIACMLILFSQFLPAQTQITFANKTDFGTGYSPYSVATSDLNGDGKSDMVVANYVSNTVSVYLNTTTPGTSTPSFLAKTDFPTGNGPYFIAIGDLNGDGKPDLVVVNFFSSSISVLFNTTTPAATSPSFSAKTDFSAGVSPRSVAIGDLNGDGRLDLVLANQNSNTVSVLLNTTTPGASAPSFSVKTDFVVGTSPRSVAIGDLNRDGKPDLAVANFNSNTVSLLLNMTTTGASTPTFSTATNFTTGIYPWSVTLCDLNGDCNLDLSVVNYSSNTVSVFFNTTAPDASTPTFSVKTDFTTTTGPYFIVGRDLDKDGKPDLVISNISSNKISVFLNTTTPGASTPAFSAKTDFTTGNNPYFVAVDDLNGDGKPDLAVANSNSNSASILLNTTMIGSSTSSFTEKSDFSTGTYPYSNAMSDLNGDGKSDLAAVNYMSNTVSVFLNTILPGISVPTFSTRTDFITGTNPRSLVIGDLNGDGKQDVVVVNYSSHTISVLLNTSKSGSLTATFSAKVDFTTGSNPYAVAMGEINGDGKPDLAVVNYMSHTVSIFLNTTSPGASIPSFSTKTDFTTGNNSYPASVVIGDLNGDGKPDLAVADRGSNVVSLFLNTTTPGASTPSLSAKTDFITGSSPNSVALGDFNGDGKLDLVVANENSHTVSLFFNMTAPGASTPLVSAKTDFATGTNPTSIAVGNLNGDGKLDLTVANLNSNTVSVFLNTTTPGDATPSLSTRTDIIAGNGPVSVAIGNLNGDGKPDLTVANTNSNTISVFLNTTTMGSSTYALSINATNGTVAVNPSTGPYNPGTSVTLTPTASVGYHFVNWSGDVPTGHETDNPLTLTMDANKTITAHFAIYTYSITASAGANGSITPAGVTTVSQAGNQNYIITPTTGYHVDNVLVDGSSVGAVMSYSFTNVSANHTINVSFTINTFTITASAGANGSIAPAGVTTVNYGSSQSYTITPATSYYVADVLVDGSSVGAVSSHNFSNVNANHAISASFASASQPQSTNIIIHAGWNFVSVPRIQSDYNADSVFHGKFADMFTYNDVIEDYEISLTLTMGRGYWVYYRKDDTITISGPVPSTITVQTTKGGWILIGSRERAIQASSLQLSNGSIIYGDVFRYDRARGDFLPTKVINPGEAIWIYVTKPCTITFP